MKTEIHIRALAPTHGFIAALALVAFLIAGTAYADVLTRQLEEGNSGADVTLLQTFLAKDPTIYPQGLVTGYFGSLTKSAVSNFQSKNGIATVGRVGPITLAALNLKMAGVSGADVDAPKITNINVIPGTNAASIHWNTNEPAAGIVYYSTTWPSMTDTVRDATVGGTESTTSTSLQALQDVNIAGLQTNTTYYYVIYARDASGNVQITWPTTFRTAN